MPCCNVVALNIPVLFSFKSSPKTGAHNSRAALSIMPCLPSGLKSIRTPVSTALSLQTLGATSVKILETSSGLTSSGCDLRETFGAMPDLDRQIEPRSTQNDAWTTKCSVLRATKITHDNLVKQGNAWREPKVHGRVLHCVNVDAHASQIHTNTCVCMHRNLSFTHVHVLNT